MYKDRILKLLRQSQPGFLSGEALAAKLGISRTMVWKHMKSLEKEGFGIEAVPSQGYRIASEPDVLRVNDIRQGLKTRIIGREILLLPETVSTNTLAMEKASQGAREGLAVIAETQTRGKGRLGRKWISPRGNLYVSVILRPDVPVHKAPLATLVGAVAVASAIRTTCRLPAAIKWPNDIQVSDKKVSGLLTEMSAETDRVKHIVLGIGVDVNMRLDELPPDIRALTTTLAEEAGGKIDRTALLRELLVCLDQEYQVFLKDPSAILRRWESLNTTINSRVTVNGAGTTLEGLAQGIDSEGRLLVRLDDGAVHRVSAGDVTIVKGKS
jgi:BirA family biotin operon repressor/biotin-[acetyl-CoA-carboxylase] ligase